MGTILLEDIKSKKDSGSPYMRGDDSDHGFTSDYIDEYVLCEWGDSISCIMVQ